MNLRDKILLLPTYSVIAYEKNAKAHPESQIDQIARSIEEFGFSQPLVVDKDNVVIVLLNAISTAPVRSKRPFSQNRKVTKVHQNILAFYKGNPEMLKKKFEDIPTIERSHHNVVVFYKGDIDEIKKNYEVVSTGLEGIEFDE